METQDYYQILNVSKDADMTQIKKAYRDLAVKYHPDRNMDDPAALETMKQINEAYAVLSERLFKLIRIWRKKGVLMRITTHGNQRSW